MDWQGSLDDWLDDRRKNAAKCVANYIENGIESAMNVHGCTREEAEDYAIDYLMTSRCGQVEGFRVNPGYRCFECGEESSWAREEFLSQPYRRRAACHWAAARWLEERKK